jgi:hypothetical protein
MTTTIPIKPHLKKFLLFTMEVKEPVVITERDMLGSAIMKVLQETRNHKFDNVLEGYTERLKLVLTESMRKRSPRLHRLVYINTQLEKDFQTGLLLWVRAQKLAGIPAKTAIINFLAALKIDENEYSYDAAAKAWIRFNEASRNKGLEVS